MQAYILPFWVGGRARENLLVPSGSPWPVSPKLMLKADVEVLDKLNDYADGGQKSTYLSVGLFASFTRM